MMADGLIGRETVETRKLRITVVYDNNPGVAGVGTGWGFSCLIQGTPKTLLFDTGGNGATLLANMNRLGIRPGAVDIVFLSHYHGDHVGGLERFLSKNHQVTVCCPASFPAGFKAALSARGVKMKAFRAAAKICGGVYTTGEMCTWIKEQSLMISTEKGTVLITGCAHPGIVKIVTAAKTLLGSDVYLVMGGFHLGGMGETELLGIIAAFKQLSVASVGPCHCSGDRARRLFREAYGENFVTIGAGSVIQFDGSTNPISGG